MFRELSAPVTLQWEVTPWCNMSCLHCYNHWRRDSEKRKRAGPETIKLYQKTTSEILSNGVFAVTVTGGEPLGILDDLSPFLKQLTEAGVELLLNSNLTLLTQKTARKLKELGIRSVLTSLPAGDPTLNDEITQKKGAHARTTRGIRIALENGIRPMVNMVVSKMNLPQIFATADYTKSLGVRSFAATRVSVPINCPDFSPYALSLTEFRFMLNELMKVKEQLGMKVDSLEFYSPCSFDNEQTRVLLSSRTCTAGKTNCTIGFDGQVRPCSRAPQTYGSIHDGLANAWKAMKPWRSGEWIPKECGNCKQKNKCMGGCKVDAYRATGCLFELDPYCDPSWFPIKRNVGKAQPLPKTDNLSFTSKLRVRREDFGGIFFSSSSHWTPVNHRLLELALNKKGDIVTIEEMATALGVSAEDARRTASFLLSKSILRERR